MNAKDKPYIAIYARKSKFTHSGDSIDIQIEKCKSYLNSSSTYDNDIDIRVYKDEGYSGGNTNRPEFQKLLNECTSNKVSILICYRLDRISRSLNDFTQLYEQLKKHDVKFISVNEQFDTSTPMGEAMLKICMVFAELERQTIAERIRDNMLGLAKTGRWLGGTTPLGFESQQLKQTISLDDKVRYLYKLETIPEEKTLFLNLLNKYFETGTLTSVQTYSHQAGLKTRNGKYFSTVSLRSLFRNPVYAAADKNTYNYFSARNSVIDMDICMFDGKHGLMAYNKTDQSDGKSHVEHPIDEWIIAVGKHKPFISGKEWVKLQQMLDNSQTRSFRRPRSNSALLSGLIRCGHCHNYMRPKTYNRVDTNGEKVYAYLCEEKEKSKGHNCNIKNPRGIELDYLVCEEIKKLSEDNNEFKRKLLEAEQLLMTESNNSQSEILLLQSSINEKDKSIKTLVKALSESENTFSHSYISDEINSLHTEKLTIEKRISELELIEQDKLALLKELSSLKEKLCNFSAIFDMMAIDEKRAVLRALVKEIVWDGISVHLYLMGSSDSNDSAQNTDINVFSEPMQRGCKRNSHVPESEKEDE